MLVTNHNPMQCVLIVEDNIDLQILYSHALRLEGYSVKFASNGQEALEYLQNPHEDKPKVILLDLMMPIMDGFQFLDIKKDNSGIREIPVVVCSALKETHRLPKDVYVLHKPVDLDKLLVLVAKYCK